MSLIKVDRDKLITACDKAIAHHKSRSEPLLEKVKHHTDEVKRECRRIDSIIGCLDKIEGCAKDRATQWYKKEFGDTVTERCGFLFLNQRTVKLTEAQVLQKAMDYFLLENTKEKFVTLPIEIEDSENNLTHNLDVTFIHGEWYIGELCYWIKEVRPVSTDSYKNRVRIRSQILSIERPLSTIDEMWLQWSTDAISKLESMKTYANHNDFYLSSDEYGLIKGFL